MTQQLQLLFILWCLVSINASLASMTGRFRQPYNPWQTTTLCLLCAIGSVTFVELVKFVYIANK